MLHCWQQLSNAEIQQLPSAEEKIAIKLKPVQNKKTAAHTLQAAAIQCRNPEATQCRKTSAEEKTAVKLKSVQRKKQKLN